MLSDGEIVRFTVLLEHYHHIILLYSIHMFVLYSFTVFLVCVACVPTFYDSDTLTLAKLLVLCTPMYMDSLRKHKPRYTVDLFVLQCDTYCNSLICRTWKNKVRVLKNSVINEMYC